MTARNNHQKTGVTALDPDIEAFVRTLSDAVQRLTGGKPVSAERRREVAEQVRETWTRGGPAMARTDDFFVGEASLRARVHVPETRRDDHSVLLYLHGGGWVMFSIDTHDRLMREYAHRTGLKVVGLDYSLSPEHRFPRALDDVDALYRWLDDDQRRSGEFTGKRFVGGDSAGANLALASTIRRRDRGWSLPDGLLLNYAAVDTETRDSHARFDGDPYMLGRAEMADFWRAYLGADATDDPYARPLLADLHGLPPTHLCIAGCDILADENLELRDRLEDARCRVSAAVYEGATHSFLEAVKTSALADAAIQDAASWINGLLAEK